MVLVTVLVARLAYYDVNKHWVTMYTHKCGHTTKYTYEFKPLCSGCSERVDEMKLKRRYARFKFFKGWEYKDV